MLKIWTRNVRNNTNEIEDDHARIEKGVNGIQPELDELRIGIVLELIEQWVKDHFAMLLK